MILDSFLHLLDLIPFAAPQVCTSDDAVSSHNKAVENPRKTRYKSLPYLISAHPPPPVNFLEAFIVP